MSLEDDRGMELIRGGDDRGHPIRLNSGDIQLQEPGKFFRCGVITIFWSSTPGLRKNRFNRPHRARPERKAGKSVHHGVKNASTSVCGHLRHVSPQPRETTVARGTRESTRGASSGAMLPLFHGAGTEPHPAQSIHRVRRFSMPANVT